MQAFAVAGMFADLKSGATQFATILPVCLRKWLIV